MPIKIVPRGTIRPEDDPLHKISMLRLQDPTKSMHPLTLEQRKEVERFMGGDPEAPSFKEGDGQPTEIERRKQLLEEGAGADYSQSERLRGQGAAPPERILTPEEASPQNIAFKPTLGSADKRKELGLTPQETMMYGRHLQNLRGPGGVDHPNGSRSTLMNMGVGIGDKYYNIPRVYDGKIVPEDEAIRRATAQGLENFPSYDSREKAEARYNELHGYMEKDAAQLFRRGPGGPLQEKTAFPIEGMEAHTVGNTSGGSYGARRDQGHHAGLDIPAKIGTPIKATDNGAVIRAGTEPGGGGYGHYLDVQLADGTVHRMAHLGTNDKSVSPYGTFKPGDVFKAGDTIAYSGRSGIKQSGPHVHYEVFPSRGMYDKALSAGNSHANVDLRVDPKVYFAGGRDAAVKENLAAQSSGAFKPGQDAAPAGSKREIARTVTSELRAAGYTDNAIAGILRNIDEESRFNPANSHFDQPAPKFRGTDAANSHGLYQEGGDEWNNMKAWMAKNHPDGHWTDPKLQTQWIAHNIANQAQYANLNKTLRDPNTTKEQAASAFLKGYLRPAPDNLARRDAHYAKGIPGVEHYTGPMPQPTAAAAAAAPKVEVQPTAPPAPPQPGPEDPSAIARAREMSQRPAPGPEDPSIQARQREQQQTAPSVGAPAGTALAPTMGEEDANANPTAGRFAAPGIAPEGGIEDPSIIARRNEMAQRPMPGVEDPRFQAYKRQEEQSRAQGSAPIAGASGPPGDFNIAVAPDASGGSIATGGAGGGGIDANSALDSWKPGQPIMQGLLGDIFGGGGAGGGGGLFGGGGKAPRFQNLVQSYTPSPDAILPAAGPEPPSTLPSSIPPPPPAPPPGPGGLAQFVQSRMHHRRA
jgi:murein DD-endopeptidase MepM/ murein hydrolase activator NlpD